MSVKDLLIGALENCCDDVFQEGTMSEDAPFPAKYITFFTVDTPSIANYDNKRAATAWRFQVTQYSNEPSTLESEFNDIRTELKSNGFIPIGKGRDLPSIEPTYIGWTQDFYYFEEEEDN